MRSDDVELISGFGSSMELLRSTTQEYYSGVLGLGCHVSSIAFVSRDGVGRLGVFHMK